MKLRNKKTGEVFNFVIKAEQDNTASYFTLKTGSGGWEDGLTYGTLEEMHEEWEDYNPTEPLIKDEKIRKAVRAWAELCGTDKCHFEHDEGSFASKWYGISLPMSKYDEDIESGFYTIAELCGEEEAPEPLEPTFVDLDERIKEKGKE